MKLVIVGGGASGLMLASILKNKNANLDIEIIEKLDHVGKKILVTGNGRCNLSNINIKLNCYNNEFGYDVANSFDVVSYFNELGLLTINDDEGRVYPMSLTANSVLDVLRESISDVKVLENTNVSKISKNNNQYTIITDNFDFINADIVVLATGGKTYYKDCNSYNLTSMLSNRVTPLRPTLTSVRVEENLASIENLKSKVKASLLFKNQVIYEDYGEVLYKKNALSGIVMFQLSSIMARDPYKTYHIELDLIPSMSEDELTTYIENHPNMTGLFAKMINQYIIKNSSSKNPKDLAHTIKHLRFNALENLDYKNAQITAGGVSLDEISENLESKYNKNLYFIGEMLDVDGICGGYNLHFAFASANKVAKDILDKVGTK